MDLVDGLSDADCVEAQLLTNPVAQLESGESIGGGKILYKATFKELERNFLNYETVQWILISLLLILAWGVGLILLLYTPVRRYVMRQDFRSRKLYVTSDAIVFKVTRPVFLPWLGVSKMEKFIFLPLITDIVLEQGCLQSLFGVHSIRIETLGQGRPSAAYNIHICGMDNPKQFRRVVLIAATTPRQQDSLSMSSSKHERTSNPGPPGMNTETGSLSQITDTPWQMFSPHSGSAADAYFSVPGEKVLRKLEDLGNSLKRIETLIGGQQSRLLEASEYVSEV